MVEVNTRIFGKIAIEDDKIIRFDHGILGFPDLKEFTLIFNEDKGADASIKWLQSLQEPGFALPVMNPDLVRPGYNPNFDEDFLKPLGDNLDGENILLFVTVTVPKDITKTTVNLKAPIIVSIENLKAVQLICDDDAYSVKHPIYEELMAQKTAQA
ncbi:MAG: flagellar assembly protein FliW [Lachnospiraceae bacterium]|nr:flagellar assembly protein FliW [Lachnospiraceae bacterium]MDE7274587.1 flagellar assembly protein FliW [Lachnospiraceae bacterium]